MYDLFLYSFQSNLFVFLSSFQCSLSVCWCFVYFLYRRFVFVCIVRFVCVLDGEVTPFRLSHSDRVAGGREQDRFICRLGGVI
jgi:hypothetical protein